MGDNSNEIFYRLISEILTTTSGLPQDLQEQLQNLPRSIRKKVADNTFISYTPLSVACARGNVEIVEYLLKVCDADIEQKSAFYSSPKNETDNFLEGNITPLCAACISGNLLVLKCLVRYGANVNAPTDSGWMPLQVACHIWEIDMAVYLVENGADVRKPNFDGKTCLFDSVLTVDLCRYLLSKGADVNARDVHDRTALHYASRHNLLETTKLLLDYGADPYAENRNGEDVLQVACIENAIEVADYLMQRINYSPERLADANELIGSTSLFTDETVLRWQRALLIRTSQPIFVEKRPTIAPRSEFGNIVEFATTAELSAIAEDVDAIRMQRLLISERILGIDHENTLSWMMLLGSFFEQFMRFQMCMDSWLLTLKVTIQKFSILHNDTLSTAQAIVRLMLNWLNGSNSNSLRFEDVHAVVLLLTSNLIEVHPLLSIQPVHQEQQRSYDRIVECLMYLLYVLLLTASNEDERELVERSVRHLLHNNVQRATNGETLLHMSVSELAVIESEFCMNRTRLNVIFPNLNVMTLLLECGALINAFDARKYTPLHIACTTSDYSTIRALIEHGAHLDLPNRYDQRPSEMIARHPGNDIPLGKHVSLRCISAIAITMFNIPYQDKLPKLLVDFVRAHSPK